jgi:hypothetical protein
MTDLEREMPKLEVDAWDEHRLRIKRRYIEQGMSDEDADDKATADVIREIRR